MIFVGATLCKGINRGFGTLLAASLAFLFEFIAREYGKIFRAVFIGASIFLVGNQYKSIQLLHICYNKRHNRLSYKPLKK